MLLLNSPCLGTKYVEVQPVCNGLQAYSESLLCLQMCNAVYVSTQWLLRTLSNTCLISLLDRQWLTTILTAIPSLQVDLGVVNPAAADVGRLLADCVILALCDLHVQAQGRKSKKGCSRRQEAPYTLLMHSNTY